MPTRTERTPYDLSAVLELEEVRAVRPGTTVLVSGPAMTGKDRFVFDVAVDGLRNGEGAIVMTTGDRARDVLAELVAGVPDADGYRVVVLDCRAEGSRSEEDHESGALLHHVSSPSDLTGTGIGITRGFERLGDAGVDRGRLAVTSLSTMLNYADTQTVFKFCHVLSSRLDSTEYVGLFTIDSSAHDEQTIQIVKQAFDGLVEIRERDGVREARVRGLTPGTSEWARL